MNSNQFKNDRQLLKEKFLAMEKYQLPNEISLFLRFYEDFLSKYRSKVGLGYFEELIRMKNEIEIARKSKSRKKADNMLLDIYKGLESDIDALFYID